MLCCGGQGASCPPRHCWAGRIRASARPALPWHEAHGAGEQAAICSCTSLCLVRASSTHTPLTLHSHSSGAPLQWSPTIRFLKITLTCMAWAFGRFWRRCTHGACISLVLTGGAPMVCEPQHGCKCSQMLRARQSGPGWALWRMLGSAHCPAPRPTAQKSTASVLWYVCEELQRACQDTAMCNEPLYRHHT